MSNNCKYFKIKMNRTFECKKQNKIINIKECNGCLFKDINFFDNKKSIKKRTYKQSKKEKERYSIIYKDLTKCCVLGCNSTYNIAKNEVYEGAKRKTSIINGFVCPFCELHHNQFHHDREFALFYKRLFQIEFEKTHTREEFINLIHYNYLKD